MYKSLLTISFVITAWTCTLQAGAETVEPIPYGDFEQWLTREVKESAIIGGAHKKLYEIAPGATDLSGKPYVNNSPSPWATSNVLARVMGITKTSNALFPDARPGGGKCAKLSTIMEHCKAIGLINIDVVVAGSMFLGKMIEPIKSTKDPYSNLAVGVPFTKRPKAIQFDYRLSVPQNPKRTYSSGFGRKKTVAGHDSAEVYLLLQHRWEDADGNLFARRVGTAVQLYGADSQGWVNGHRVPVIYGNPARKADYISHMALQPAATSYRAYNSKGKLVPVHEVGWGKPGDQPTHMVLMFSAANGEPYTGTLGMTFWVDNVGFVYD